MLELVPITLKEANAFVEQHHRHHKPVVGHKFSIAASDGEKIVGVAIVGRPVSRYLDNGLTLEVFYQTYRPLQKRYNLRLHSHFDVYGNDYIEIWEYKGDVRGSRICMVKEEGEVACYRRAIEELKNYEGNRKDRENEKRAG